MSNNGNIIQAQAHDGSVIQSNKTS